mgnify:FL=1
MKRMLVEGMLFVLAAGLIVHVLYGNLGFCPTDEGYMLSGSRRILDGEIPHRDYISLRPVGTQILHAHLLLWAGENLIWWSRLLTWFEVAATTWLWILIARHFSTEFQCARRRLIVAAIAFLAATNSFPIMPWNTYDALFFLSLGIVLHLFQPRLSWLGMIFIGMSTIFRQNYVFPIPLLLLALGELFRLRSWILVALPGTFYLAAMAATGGLHDMVVQMTSHKGSLVPALLPFLGFTMPFLQGLLIGGAAAVAGNSKRPTIRLFGNLLHALALLYSAFILPFTDTESSMGWFLFGVLILALPFLFRLSTSLFRFLSLVLIMGWGAAISEGHPQPSLIASALVIALAACMMELERKRTGSGVPVFRRAIVLSLLVSLYAFHRGRVAQINCDLNAEYLTHELGDALPGARLIRTNPNTHAFLSDLTRLTDSLRVSGRRYAVVPECTQFWVTSPQRNPLSTDWPIDPELRGEALMKRVLDDVDSIRGSVTFIVQKHWVVLLPFQRALIREGESAVVDRIRKTCRKTGETEFFELYE